MDAMSADARALFLEHLTPLLDRGVDARNLADDARLKSDLGLSSLDALNLVMALEGALDSEISDSELASLSTVGDVVALIDAKLRRGPSPSGAA
jgi:acyl carrier protein